MQVEVYFFLSALSVPSVLLYLHIQAVKTTLPSHGPFVYVQQAHAHLCVQACALHQRNGFMSHDCKSEGAFMQPIPGLLSW